MKATLEPLRWEFSLWPFVSRRPTHYDDGIWTLVVGPLCVSCVFFSLGLTTKRKTRTCPLVSRVWMCRGTLSGHNNRSMATTTAYRWYERSRAVSATTTPRNEGRFLLLAIRITIVRSGSKKQKQTLSQGRKRRRHKPASLSSFLTALEDR